MSPAVVATFFVLFQLAVICVFTSSDFAAGVALVLRVGSKAGPLLSTRAANRSGLAMQNGSFLPGWTRRVSNPKRETFLQPRNGAYCSDAHLGRQLQCRNPDFWWRHKHSGRKRLQVMPGMTAAAGAGSAAGVGRSPRARHVIHWDNHPDYSPHATSP